MQMKLAPEAQPQFRAGPDPENKTESRNENRPENRPEDRPENRNDRLIELINPMLEPLGYELVHVEVQTHRHKVLRLFIDFSEAAGRAREEASGSPAGPGVGRTTGPAIGIEDCVK